MPKGFMTEEISRKNKKNKENEKKDRRLLIILKI